MLTVLIDGALTSGHLEYSGNTGEVLLERDSQLVEHSPKQQLLKSLWAGMAAVCDSRTSTKWLPPPLGRPPLAFPERHSLLAGVAVEVGT